MNDLDNQDRLDRLIAVVTDLCQQDLASFLDSCYNICKYNQQHLAELGLRIRSEFPQKFLNCVHNNLERQST